MTDSTGMGPEALLVRARVDPRVVLAEYALRDCTREGVRALEEMLRRDLEAFPVRRTLTQRLRGWGRQRLRRVDVPLAAAPALAREEVGSVDAAARAYDDATLAAMPALRALGRPAGAEPLMCAMPVYARE
jgi:hypothetical protein